MPRGKAGKADFDQLLYNDLQLTKQIKLPQALIVRSKIKDPYVNLAIENYLLSHSKPESRIYFFYVNRPCIVIGRNQNPWLEVNLQKLRESRLPAELVRRRSGGGTVFHDHGNLNYCAIMPSNLFTRNLHAQALADALNRVSIDKPTAGTFMVNDRHDVVFQAEDNAHPFKVSGSAYKLTKGRALHHGTCLVSSPNLSQISQYLRSPAKAFITAKGVESVSSKIGNVLGPSSTGHAQGQELDGTMDKIIGQFLYCIIDTDDDDVQHYRIKDLGRLLGLDGAATEPQAVANEISVDSEALKDRDWKYLQTPRFTFDSHPPSTSGGEGGQPSTSKESSLAQSQFNDLHGDERIHLHVKSGVIEDGELSCLRPGILLRGRALHQVEDWRDFVTKETIGNWLNHLLLCPTK